MGISGSLLAFEHVKHEAFPRQRRMVCARTAERLPHRAATTSVWEKSTYIEVLSDGSLPCVLRHWLASGCTTTTMHWLQWFRAIWCRNLSIL
jgi:hypothetical protein